jgi:hypothetical protein
MLMSYLFHKRFTFRRAMRFQLSQATKKMMNVLLINQVTIDLYCSIMIIVTYSVNLTHIYFIGTSGYVLCLMVSGEQLMGIGLNSSAINLVVITVERYIKVVHSVWHKNRFKRWMVFFGCAFSWVSGFVGNFFSYLFTTYVSDGQCMPLMQFTSQSGQLSFLWFNYLYYFQVPLVIFVVCYFRIFQVIRRQNRIFQQPQKNACITTAAASAAAAAAKSRKSSQSQINAVKTMIFTTMFFAVSWLPTNVYAVVAMTTGSAIIGPLWLVTVFVALFNVCVNPFIYIVGYDDVRMYLSKKVNGLLNTIRGQSVDNQSIVISGSECNPTALTTRGL